MLLNIFRAMRLRRVGYVSFIMHHLLCSIKESASLESGLFLDFSFFGY
jgi:hypothetical protein